MAQKSGVLFFFMIANILFSQDLPQLRLVGQPEKSATEFVGSNIVDVNGKVCAAIQVLSDLDGLQYDVYNQLKRVDRQPGRDMVYIQAEEQVLEILHSGYQPLKLVLLESGIRLASRVRPDRLFGCLRFPRGGRVENRTEVAGLLLLLRLLLRRNLGSYGSHNVLDEHGLRLLS